MRARLPAALAVSALLAAACGSAATPDAAPDVVASTATDDAPTGDPAATSPPVVASEGSSGGSVATVPDTLDFTAPAVTGGQVVGAEFAGDAVALWFWAPW